MLTRLLATKLEVSTVRNVLIAQHYVKYNIKCDIHDSISLAERAAKRDTLYIICSSQLYVRDGARFNIHRIVVCQYGHNRMSIPSALPPRAGGQMQIILQVYCTAVCSLRASGSVLAPLPYQSNLTRQHASLPAHAAVCASPPCSMAHGRAWRASALKWCSRAALM